MSWLTDATDHVAKACGLDRTALSLDPAEVAEILDLARVASHASGDRTNAPVLCFVLGTARANGTPLEDLARAVREFAPGV